MATSTAVPLPHAHAPQRAPEAARKHEETHDKVHERVLVLETRWEDTAPQFATKTDLSQLEVRMSRWFMGTILGTLIPVLFAIVGSFLMLQANITATATRLDARIDRIDAKVNQLSDRMERRFEKIDQRFAEMDQRFGEMEKQFTDMFGLLLREIRQQQSESTSH